MLFKIYNKETQKKANSFAKAKWKQIMQCKHDLGWNLFEIFLKLKPERISKNDSNIIWKNPKHILYYKIWWL